MTPCCSVASEIDDESLSNRTLLCLNYNFFAARLERVSWI